MYPLEVLHVEITEYLNLGFCWCLIFFIIIYFPLSFHVIQLILLLIYQQLKDPYCLMKLPIMGNLLTIFLMLWNCSVSVITGICDTVVNIETADCILPFIAIQSLNF